MNEPVEIIVNQVSTYSVIIGCISGIFTFVSLLLAARVNDYWWIGAFGGLFLTVLAFWITAGMQTIKKFL